VSPIKLLLPHLGTLVRFTPKKTEGDLCQGNLTFAANFFSAPNVPANQLADCTAY
jgi:hypothetical protein